MTESEKINIKELIDAAKEGDANAFGKIYEIYFVPVYRYIYIRVRDKSLAQDLVQEVFLKLYKTIHNYKDIGKSPLNLFFTIARNSIVDFWRKKKELNLDENEQFIEISDKSFSPEKIFEAKEKSDFIQRMLAILNDDQREVIQLKFIAGLDNKEIAQLLEKSENNIRQIQCRALKEIRTKFNYGNK